MQNQTFHIPFSKTILEFNLLPGMQADMAVSRPAVPIKDAPSAIQAALEHPIGTSPLRGLAKAGNRVCIVFTDITRSSPDHLLVPALLIELEKAGVRDENITLLCGIAMHRLSTQAEKITKLGADIVSRYRVIDNEPQNPAARDGFCGERREGGDRLWGRLQGVEYRLEVDRDTDQAVFSDGRVTLELRHRERTPVGASVVPGAPEGHTLDVGAYLKMAVLLDGVLDPRHASPVNA